MLLSARDALARPAELETGPLARSPPLTSPGRAGQVRAALSDLQVFLLAFPRTITDYPYEATICETGIRMVADKSWAFALDTLSLTDEIAREAMISRAELRRFPAGASIIAQDDEEDQVFLLLDGSVRVVLLSEGGQEIWLDTLQPGTILGELAALTDRRRTSEIIAETDCELASYSATAFLTLLKQHGELGLALARILARRVRHTTQRMFELSALSAPGRVYAEILRMSESSAAGRTRTIQPIPSLTAVAVRVNTTRETVSRTISDLERRGLLRRREDAFELVDPDHLARLSTAS